MSGSRQERFTLGRLARQVGLARSSILHYESIGLLVPGGRSAAGYRLYGSAELERLRVTHYGRMVAGAVYAQPFSEGSAAAA